MKNDARSRLVISGVGGGRVVKGKKVAMDALETADVVMLNLTCNPLYCWKQLL